MTKTILFLLTMVPTLLFGQKTKKITDKETNEIYYVLKSDRTVKHGQYEKLSYKNSILIKGFYKNGIKDSIWECYNLGGEIIQKFDCNKNELTFYKPDEKEKDKKYKIINGLDNPETTLSRPPIFLGGQDYISSILIKNLRYPQDAVKNGISGKLLVSFIVDKNGKTSNYQVKNPLGHGLDEEAIRVLKLLPDNWLPGILNGQAVDTEVVYPIVFRLQ